MMLKDVKAAVSADSCSRKTLPDGTVAFTVRRGFFYTNGRTAAHFAEIVKIALPNVRIIDSGEVWRPFRGGASTAQQSHWFVTFTETK